MKKKLLSNLTSYWDSSETRGTCQTTLITYATYASTEHDETILVNNKPQYKYYVDVPDPILD